MKQRFVGLAAALALCCTVSGAMLERAVCCPAPPGLAHIEKQFQTMVGMEKGDGNWLYSYQMLSAPKYAVCATAVRTGGSGRRESVRVLWRLENGVWRLVYAVRRSHPRQYKMRRDKADERKNGCFSGAHSTASGLAQRGMHCVANADGKLGRIFRCRNDGMPKAKNASGTCRGPGGVLCWLKSVCGNNGCISRQLP